VLGNLTPSSFPEALTKILIDQVFGLPADDWNAHYTSADKKTEADRLTADKKRETDRKKDTKPSRELEAYAGKYTEPAYGKAEVTHGKNGLQINWGRIVVQLDHYHFDTFTGHVIGPTSDDVVRYQRQTFDVQFRLGKDGNVDGMKFLDQEFVRAKK
jgi:hypothetical protein